MLTLYLNQQSSYLSSITNPDTFSIISKYTGYISNITIGDTDIKESFTPIPEVKREIDSNPLEPTISTRLKEDPIPYNESLVKEEIKVEDKIERLPHMEYVGSIFGTYLIFQNCSK